MPELTGVGVDPAVATDDADVPGVDMGVPPIEAMEVVLAPGVEPAVAVPELTGVGVTSDVTEVLGPAVPLAAVVAVGLGLGVLVKVKHAPAFTTLELVPGGHVAH